MRRLNGDTVLGIIVVVVGAAVLVTVAGFPELPGGRPGPGLFPQVLGVLAMLFGIALTVRSVRTPDTAGAASGDGLPPAEPRVALVNALLVVGAVIVYLVVSPYLGFIVTMTIIVTGLMLRLGTGPVRALLISLPTVLVVDYVFASLLGVPLPTML